MRGINKKNKRIQKTVNIWKFKKTNEIKITFNMLQYKYAQVFWNFIHIWYKKKEIAINTIVNLF